MWQVFFVCWRSTFLVVDQIVIDFSFDINNLLQVIMFNLAQCFVIKVSQSDESIWQKYLIGFSEHFKVWSKQELIWALYEKVSHKEKTWLFTSFQSPTNHNSSQCTGCYWHALDCNLTTHCFLLFHHGTLDSDLDHCLLVEKWGEC